MIHFPDTGIFGKPCGYGPLADFAFPCLFAGLVTRSAVIAAGCPQFFPVMSEFTSLRTGDALLVVNIQNDFLPGGALAVPRGDEVVPVLNRYLQVFAREHLPVFATRDWHPADHVSFRSRGGIWPSHCIMETAGAAFPASLALPDNVTVISKASGDREAYSGFDGTALDKQLREAGVKRLFCRRTGERLLCVADGAGRGASWIRRFSAHRRDPGGERE